jgi:hypothetical protein
MMIGALLVAQHTPNEEEKLIILIVAMSRHQSKSRVQNLVAVHCLSADYVPSSKRE